MTPLPTPLPPGRRDWLAQPPYHVSVVYRDHRATVYFHERTGTVCAYDNLTEHHVWGGRAWWSALIRLEAEQRLYL